jgi:hypothetical protein
VAALGPSVRRLAARKAGKARHRGADPETAAQLAEAQVDEYVRRTVARLAEVSLTEDQRSRLATLLRGTHSDGGAAA